MQASNTDKSINGLWYAVGAYLCWGFFPLFWKTLKDYSAWEILIYRVLWSFLFYIGIVVLQKKTSQLKVYFHKPKLLALTLGSSALIAINWLVFIWAVNSGHTIESSLGYFINPVLNIFLGLLFFKEKLSKSMWWAFAIVLCAVAWLVLQSTEFPWVALSLALTFSLYGLLRKVSKQDAIIHSTMESGVLVPLALLAAPSFASFNPFIENTSGSLLLALGGIGTGFVLWIFAIGAKSLNYSTMGFIQYLAPTLQFLTGVFIFKESLSQERLICFILIWISVAIVFWDLYQKSRTAKQIAPPAL